MDLQIGNLMYNTSDQILIFYLICIIAVAEICKAYA